MLNVNFREAPAGGFTAIIKTPDYSKTSDGKTVSYTPDAAVKYTKDQQLAWNQGGGKANADPFQAAASSPSVVDTSTQTQTTQNSTNTGGADARPAWFWPAIAGGGSLVLLTAIFLITRRS